MLNKTKYLVTKKNNTLINKQNSCVHLFCRGVHPPARDYSSHADRDHTSLVEAFRIMQIEEEGQLELDDVLDEV